MTGPMLFITRFSFLLSLSSIHAEEHHRLSPDTTLWNLQLKDGKSCYVSLENLSSMQNYELRVSYPAIVPSEFLISITQNGVIKGRTLLNIEKTTFKTGNSIELYTAKVTAYRIGVPLLAERLEDPVTLSLTLDTLYYGASQGTWQMVGLLLIGLWMIIKIAVPRLHCYLTFIAQDTKQYN